MELYHLLSSSSLQTVPCNLESGNFDQLKLFKGLAGCGTFFLSASGLGGGGADENESKMNGMDHEIIPMQYH